MPKFSRAPWHLDRDNCWVGADGEPIRVSKFYVAFPSTHTEKSLANGVLLGQAASLFDALEKLTQVFESYSDFSANKSHRDVRDIVLNDAYRALEAAKGEEFIC